MRILASSSPETIENVELLKQFWRVGLNRATRLYPRAENWRLPDMPFQTYFCDLALPDDRSPPSLASKGTGNLAVAQDVFFELAFPEHLTGLGNVGQAATGMPVPEAAMDEYRSPDYIGRTMSGVPGMPFTCSRNRNPFR